MGGEQSTWRMRQEEAMLVWLGGEPAHDCAATPGASPPTPALLQVLSLLCFSVLCNAQVLPLLAPRYWLLCCVHCSQCTGPPTALLLSTLAPPTDPHSCSVFTAELHCTEPVGLLLLLPLIQTTVLLHIVHCTLCNVQSGQWTGPLTVHCSPDHCIFAHCSPPPTDCSSPL